LVVTDRATLGRPTRPRVARSSRKRRRRSLIAYLYILPALAVYGVFLLFPLGRSVWISLFHWDGLTLATWAGFSNYVDIFSDGSLRSAFEHALILIVFYSVLPVCLALLLTMSLSRGRIRGRTFFRTVFFLPQVIAMVVVATAWSAIYSPDGVLNKFLDAIGLHVLTRPWLGDFSWALPAVGLIGTWVEVGLCVVLFMAGIQKIPIERYEAARIDGCGALRELLAVTVPGLRGEIAVALTLTVVAALRNFDLVYITTHGGPGTSTTVPAFEVYHRAFETNQVGSACAIGVTLAVLIFLITLVITRIAERGEA
jgi:raffinose/stachyose/melibiose transport system permease protein